MFLVLYRHISFAFGLLLILQVGACAKPRSVRTDSPARDQQPSSQPAQNSEGTKPNSDFTCDILFKNSGWCLVWSWEKVPDTSDFAVMTFDTYKRDSANQIWIPVDLLEVPEVSILMPSMSHPPDVASTSHKGLGSYRASEMDFFMLGEWEIRVKVKLNGNTIDEASFRVQI